MKILRCCFLALCAASELFLIIFGIIGISIYAGDPEPGVPRLMVVSETVCAVVLLGLTVFSLYRVIKGVRAPILRPFLMKIPAVFLWMGVVWFSLDIPEAGWLAVIVAILLGGLILLLPDHGGIGGRNERPQKVRLPEFRSDKAEWAFEEAAIEDLRLHGQNIDTGTAEGRQALDDYLRNLTDEESDRIYDCAGMPIAYFLGWLIARNLVSEEFLSIMRREDLEAVRNERLTPSAVLQNMDYVLSREDIRPEAHKFMDFYYETWNLEEFGPYNHRRHQYFADYYKVVCSGYDVPRYYCAPFTLGNFHRLCEVLDLRYREFTEPGFDEEKLEATGRKVRSQYFAKEAELLMEPGVSDEYADRCAAAFEYMGEHLVGELSGNLIEYCPEELAEENMLPEKVLPHFEPIKMAVLKPDTEDAPPAYLLLGESDWEEEHGLSFTVIGEYVVSCAYYSDAASPWEEDLQWKYRIRKDAEDGNYCMANVIPERFGGSGTADNQVRIPAAAAARKDEYDDLVEALYMRKMASSYDCRLTYDGDVPNYLFISATNGKVRTYADSMPLR